MTKIKYSIKSAIEAILLSLLFCAALCATASAANCTVDGPQESFVYEYTYADGIDSPHNYTSTEQYYEYVQNWSITTSQPYGSVHVHHTAAGKALTSYDDESRIDFYSTGGYTDAACTVEADVLDGNYSYVYNPSSLDPLSKLTRPGNDQDGAGYQYNFSQVSTGGHRVTKQLSEQKRFRVGGNPSFTSTVTFSITAWLVDPATGGLTSVNPSAGTIYLTADGTTHSVNSSGQVTFSWLADNTWRALTVGVNGQANIKYSITFISCTNPG